MAEKHNEEDTLALYRKIVKENKILEEELAKRQKYNAELDKKIEELSSRNFRLNCQIRQATDREMSLKVQKKMVQAEEIAWEKAVEEKKKIVAEKEAELMELQNQRARLIEKINGTLPAIHKEVMDIQTKSSRAYAEANIPMLKTVIQERKKKLAELREEKKKLAQTLDQKTKELEAMRELRKIPASKKKALVRVMKAAAQVERKNLLKVMGEVTQAEAQLRELEIFDSSQRLNNSSQTQ